MVFTPWETAHGEAEEVRLECLPVVALSPDDDSVDTNSVVIFGTGTIRSFGASSHRIVMRVEFEPNQDSPIYLEGGALLNLLVASGTRTVRAKSFATYKCDGDSRWVETSFVEVG